METRARFEEKCEYKICTLMCSDVRVDNIAIRGLNYVMCIGICDRVLAYRRLEKAVEQ